MKEAKEGSVLTETGYAPVRAITKNAVYTGLRIATLDPLSESELDSVMEAASKLTDLSDADALEALIQNELSGTKITPPYAWWKVANRLAKEYFERKGDSISPIDNRALDALLRGISPIQSSLESPQFIDVQDKSNFKRFKGIASVKNEIGDDEDRKILGICPGAGFARKWHDTAQIVINRLKVEHPELF